MKLKQGSKLFLTEDEKITLNQATSILSNICDIYEEYCCKDCPLATICERHADTIANSLNKSLDKIEVEIK